MVKAPGWWPDARERHRVALWAWTLLLYPSLFWWRDAVWWVVVMSHWANLAGEASATQAARLDPRDIDLIAERVAELLQGGA